MKLPVESKDVGKLPPTVSECDWRETQDMLDFQAFVGTIKIHDGVPQVTATGVPLSVMIAAHHNLVTYGVPFVNPDGVWTNPGPTKTFYVPEEAIMQLAPRLDEMSGDATVSTWASGKKAENKLDGGGVPGMKKWVEWARINFIDHPRTAESHEAWLMFHGFTDRWSQNQWTEWETWKLRKKEFREDWSNETKQEWLANLPGRVQQAIAERFQFKEGQKS